MTLPSNVQFSTVKGRYMKAALDDADIDRDPTGDPWFGLQLTFEASWRAVDDKTADTPTHITLEPVIARTNAEGDLVGKDDIPGIRLVASNDPSLTPTGWTWRVTITGEGYPTERFNFQAPANEVVDLIQVEKIPVDLGREVTAWQLAIRQVQLLSSEFDAKSAAAFAAIGKAVSDFNLDISDYPTYIANSDAFRQKVLQLISENGGGGGGTGGITESQLLDIVEKSNGLVHNAIVDLAKASVNTLSESDISTLVKNNGGELNLAVKQLIAAASGGGNTTPGLSEQDIASAALVSSGTLNNAIKKLIAENTGLAGTPQTIAQTLNIGARPGKNHFLLQVAPVGAATIDTITQDQLEAGYSLDPNFMRVVPDDGNSRVQMWTRMDGATTSGSSYSRTELREVEEDGVTLVGFDMKKGVHWLRGKTRIMNLSAVKPETVIAQLHNGAADRIAIRTQLISGQIKLLARVNGAAVLPRFAEPYVLGTEFEWMIKVANGICYIYFNDMLTPVITTNDLVPTAGINTWYFKTGNYGQSNVSLGEQPTDFNSIQLRSLQHWHTGWATPDKVDSYRVAGGSSGAGVSLNDVNALINQHITAQQPHKAYDTDMQDLSVLFENRLV